MSKKLVLKSIQVADLSDTKLITLLQCVVKATPTLSFKNFDELAKHCETHRDDPGFIKWVENRCWAGGYAGVNVFYIGLVNYDVEKLDPEHIGFEIKELRGVSGEYIAHTPEKLIARKLMLLYNKVLTSEDPDENNAIFAYRTVVKLMRELKLIT